MAKPFLCDLGTNAGGKQLADVGVSQIEEADAGQVRLASTTSASGRIQGTTAHRSSTPTGTAIMATSSG